MTISLSSWRDIYDVAFPILGLAVLLWGLRWTRPKKEKPIGKKTGESKQDPIPAILTPQFLNPKNDAVQYLLISGRNFSGLSILRGVEGWPVQYPLGLYNTRPVPIELVGFTVKISLNGTPIPPVSWNKPDTFASNGATMGHPIYIIGDSQKLFNVPVFLSQIQSTLPDASPSWSAVGEFRFQGDKEIVKKRFEFTNDNYLLSQADWDDLRKHAFPK